MAPHDQKPPQSSSAYTYVNGIGFLPNSPKQQEKKALNFQISVLVLAFLLLFFLRAVLALPVLRFLRLFGMRVSINTMTGLITLSDTALQLCDLLVYLLSMSVTCIVVYLLSRNKARQPALLSLPSLQGGFLSYWMLLGAAVVAEAASRLFLHLISGMGLVPMAQTYDPPSDFLPFVLYLFSITLLPAVLEEVLFRGVLLQSLRRFDEMFAIFVSAAFFTLMQPNMERMLFGFILGIAMGFFALRKGGLLICILVNFSTRALEFLISMTQQSDPQNNLIVWSLSSFVILSAACCAFYLYTKHKQEAFRLTPDQSALTNREKVRYLFSNVGFWALIVFAFFTAINRIEIIN